MLFGRIVGVIFGRIVGVALQLSVSPRGPNQKVEIGVCRSRALKNAATPLTPTPSGSRSRPRRILQYTTDYECNMIGYHI